MMKRKRIVLLVIMLLSCFSCADNRQEDSGFIGIQRTNMNAILLLNPEDETQLKQMVENLPDPFCDYPEFMEQIGGEENYPMLIAQGVFLYYSRTHTRINYSELLKEDYDRIFAVLSLEDKYSYLVDWKEEMRKYGENPQDPDYSGVSVYRIDAECYEICSKYR